MATTKKLNSLIREPFTVKDNSGNRITGLVTGNFTIRLTKDEADYAVSVTIVEIGNGDYVAKFTPTNTGIWFLTISHATYNPIGWEATYNVTQYGEVQFTDEFNVRMIDITNNVLAETAYQNNAISDRVLAADVDTYQAKVWFFDDNAGVTDRYAVVWHKNSQPVTSGITSPTIQVIKASDGTDLVASTALTQVASTGLYKYDETVNRVVSGAVYYAKVQATIDGATRTWYQQIGRDTA